jgi:hypothetical protein
VSTADVVKLLLALEPAAQSAVGALVHALHSKDPAAVREAVESALRLQFEARQAAKK